MELCGFGNHFASEAVKGALPHGQNTPQKVNYGLYAEQISGSSFTSPRHENFRTWVYRIRPSVCISKPFEKVAHPTLKGFPFSTEFTTPTPLRWNPLPSPQQPTDFISGLTTMVGTGHALRGGAVHHYGINQSMNTSYFYNADGEFLIIPQEGVIHLRTELGRLSVAPGSIALVPKGLKFAVDVDGLSKGYVAENYGLPFRLPGLGPIGANGLANPRDFIAPSAWYEDKKGNFNLICKFQGQLWKTEIAHSPLDVVGWHGNLTPYSYDLSLFQAVSPVTFDHPDPSIFTVLTSPSETPGMANLDFVIFPPRWLVMEHSFRPPYFHRNLMSEYMGLIRGVYESKQHGFLPGGASLHNSFSAHGPDAATFERASQQELKPDYLGSALAFMVEGSLPFCTTEFAMKTSALQTDYLDCWKGLNRQFLPPT